ncbi:MAG TPA: response regulator [Anaerolineae bacterium]
MPGKRILIVDDEPKVGFFLKETLESLGRGYTVSHVESGEAALDEMARQPFELVVTDLRMSGMSGLDLLNHLRDLSPHTQTILITAYGNEEVETESRRLRAARYFTKPFPIDEFTAAVQDMLTERSTDMPLLDKDRLDHISQRLSDLRFEVGAQCILLANRRGQLIAEVGLTEGLTPPTLAELIGGSFTSLFDVARYLHEGHAFNLTYHEGVRYDIYAANVGDHFFLTLVFDRRQGASRIGMVWLYTKRAIQDLLDMVFPSTRPHNGK